jgi:hypothetical protein
MRVLSDVHERIAVRCPQSLVAKHRHELASFARYCIRRMEREVVAHRHWTIELAFGPGGWTCHAIAEPAGAGGNARVVARDSSRAIRCAIECAAAALAEAAPSPLARSA